MSSLSVTGRSGLSGIVQASKNPNILDGTYSQSSVYKPGSGISDGTILAANMIDEGVSGNTTSSWAGTLRESNSWLACMHSAETVNGVKVQAGAPIAWGPISPYLNGVEVQTFNGTIWTTRLTLSGITDSGSVFPFSFAPVAGATGTRLFNPATNWLATALLIPQRVI
jgi:hypothetical protein